MLGNEIEIKLMSYNTHVGAPKEVLKHEYKVLLSALCLLLYLSSICRSVFFFPQKYHDRNIQSKPPAPLDAQFIYME